MWKVKELILRRCFRVLQVRLKKYLEMRGADCGPRPFLLALPAFWVHLCTDLPDSLANLLLWSFLLIEASIVGVWVCRWDCCTMSNHWRGHWKSSVTGPMTNVRCSATRYVQTSFIWINVHLNFEKPSLSILHKVDRLQLFYAVCVCMQAPRIGLQVPFRGGLLKDVAQKVVKLAREGLIRRGRNEERFLAPIEEVASSGIHSSKHKYKCIMDKFCCEMEHWVWVCCTCRSNIGWAHAEALLRELG